MRSMHRIIIVPTLSLITSMLGGVPLHADVPFQELADFGQGGTPTDANADGVISGILFIDDLATPVIWPSATSQPIVLPTDGLEGDASAINSDGLVVGHVRDGDLRMPRLWEGGERIALPDLGEGGSALDVNESGVIVGYVIIKGRITAARWIDRQLELLETPDLGAPGLEKWSVAQSINSSGEVTGTVGLAFESVSAALRWNPSGTAEQVNGGGTLTDGISIDNVGGIVINGLFESETIGRPARLLADGGVELLEIPEDASFVAATAMSRNSIACGYYFTGEGSRLKAAAWPAGVFTPLELPQGKYSATPLGVGVDGVVLGLVTGMDGAITPGFWALDVEDNFMLGSGTSGELGQEIELSAASLRKSGPNVGHSVAFSIDGTMVGRAITGADGVARLSFVVPPDALGDRIELRFTDENGATGVATIDLGTGCVPADLDCDGSVGALDLAAVLAAWGPCSGCAADLDHDGSVGAIDLAAVLAAWGG